MTLRTDAHKRLAIVTQDPANRGGVLRLVEYIYQRAVAAGLEPTLLHYARFAEHPELSSSFANLLRGELNLSPRTKHYEFEGMRAIAIGTRLPEWEPNRIRGTRLWRRELDQFDAFVLVTGSAHTGAPLADIRKPFGAWVSSTVVSDRGERLRNSRNIPALVERLGLLSILKTEARVLARARRILAVSNAARHDLQSLTKRPIEVWPFPVDTERFHCQARMEPPPRFLFVGRANDPRKRVNLFVSSCAELRKMAPELKFGATIVSSMCPQIPEVDGVAFQFRSGLSDAELTELYGSSSALVLTSEQEGLGIAAMESMACSTPVISTRCGGPETFIEDNISGFFVNADPRKIAEAMYSLVTQPELREKMGKSARDTIERAFSEHIWNAKFEKLLQNLPLDQ